MWLTSRLTLDVRSQFEWFGKWISFYICEYHCVLIDIERLNLRRTVQTGCVWSNECYSVPLFNQKQPEPAICHKISFGSNLQVSFVVSPLAHWLFICIVIYVYMRMFVSLLRCFVVSLFRCFVCVCVQRASYSYPVLNQVCGYCQCQSVGDRASISPTVVCQCR